jgi:alpha/beta superfamily hydrolase
MTSDKAQILRPLADFATNMTNLAEVQKHQGIEEKQKKETEHIFSRRKQELQKTSEGW